MFLIAWSWTCGMLVFIHATFVVSYNTCYLVRSQLLLSMMSTKIRGRWSSREEQGSMKTSLDLKRHLCRLQPQWNYGYATCMFEPSEQAQSGAGMLGYMLYTTAFNSLSQGILLTTTMQNSRLPCDGHCRLMFRLCSNIVSMNCILFCTGSGRPSYLIYNRTYFLL